MSMTTARKRRRNPARLRQVPKKLTARDAASITLHLGGIAQMQIN